MKKGCYIRRLVPAVLIVTAALAEAGAGREQEDDSLLESDDEDASWFGPDAWLLGGGFEYDRDSDERTYGIPLYVEFSPTDELTLSLYQAYYRIDSKLSDEDSLTGFGDLYTSVEYEVLEEGELWPSLSLVGGVRWPTATEPDLGDIRRDYDVGLLATEEFEDLSLEAEVLYTFMGDPEEENELGFYFEAEWYFREDFYAIAELSNSISTGRARNQVSGTGSEFDVYLGLGWDVTGNLALEQGLVLYEGGEWQLAFYWECTFGE